MLSLTQLGWLSLALALLLNLAVAWRVGRTPRSRWIVAGLYTAVLGVLNLGVLLMLAGASRLISSLDLEVARAWLPTGVSGFWALVLGGVWLRLRRYNE
ncbi:MAG: hypothetical protein H0T53_13835 [Herpetosiphonaceae bacterium]|nr:hypothetical protein [Herpetosiphonaceae bacterium]